MSVLSSLGIKPDMLMVNIIGFLILLWLLRPSFRAIGEFMTHRSEEIAAQIDEARQTHEQAEQERRGLQAELEQQRAAARDEIAHMTQEAKAAIEQLQKEARHQRQEMIELGRAELERSKEAALAELKKQVTDMALGISSRVMKEALDEERQAALIDNFLADVEKAAQEGKLA